MWNPKICHSLNAINSIKQNKVDTHQIIRFFMDDLVLNVEKKNLFPIKEFIDFVFGKNIVLEKYKLYENVITVWLSKN